MRKRLLAALVAMVMVVVMAPVAMAEDDEELQMSGECGATDSESNVTWALTETGNKVTVNGEELPAYLLTISGQGRMADYELINNAVTSPWVTWRQVITDIVVEDGITYTGAYAFRSFSNLANVQLAESVTEIGYCSFSWTSRSTNDGLHIDFPSQLQKIGASAFNASKLNGNFILPATVTEIGDAAFQGGITCPAISIIVMSEKVKVGNIAFGSRGSLIALDLSRVTDLTLVHVQTTYNDFGVTQASENTIIYVNGDTQLDLFTEEPDRYSTAHCKALAVTNGGIIPENTTFENGVLAVPIEDGYTFEGWYTSVDFKDETKVTDNKVPEDVGERPTYYARWTEDTSGHDIAENQATQTLTMTYGREPASTTATIQVPTDGGDLLEAVSSNNAFTAELDKDNHTVTIKAVDDLNAGKYEGYIYVYTGDEDKPSTHWIKVTLTVNKANMPLSFDQSSVSMTMEDDAFTNALTGVMGGADVTYQSGDTTVATVDEYTGEVTIVGEGTTTITATAEETKNYNGATISYTLNVGDPDEPPYIPPVPSYLITLPDPDNGTVTSNRTTARQGATVILTVIPDDGYTLSEISVTDFFGSRVDVTRNSDGTYSFVMPYSQVEVSVTFAAEEPIVFTDVPEGAYYYDPVYWAVANGVTDGTSEMEFSPGRTVTRGEMVTFLWRAAGSPEPAATVNPFTDVGVDDYYYTAVLWAVENGITDGVSATEFDPDGQCTRAQMVTFLWRAAGEPDPAATSNPFTDVDGEEYYYEAVLWAVANGVTDGTSDTTFDPALSCTRAQAVTFLYRAQG